MKKRKYIWFSLVVCIIMSVIGAIIFLTKNDNYGIEMPNDARNLIETYMSAFKKGTDKSVEYAHFESDFLREAYAESGDKLLDYRIESVKKISDTLFALTVMSKTEGSTFHNGDIYQLSYNFVTLIDGKWHYIINVSQIPAYLKENLDESEYTYDDENIVNPIDVVDVIDFD